MTNPAAPPTTVRYSVVGMATLVAFLMYLDRICVSWIVGSDSFKSEIHLTPSQLDWIKGAFFWAYALAQVPAGWLSDRFGARVLMTIYITLWSLFTIATSLSTGFVTLAVARIGCGLAEAGAYPASSSILTRWSHIQWRGLGSSIISTGGRVGGALAPWLTAAVVIAVFNSWRWVGWIYGVTGVIVAVGFWIVFRDRPREHPWTNEAERALLEEGREGKPQREPPQNFPWKAALTSSSLWFASLYQLTTNVGWAYLVNSLSGYLKDVKHMSDADNGLISTKALLLGIVGLPLGGLLTDYLTKKYGARLGRMLPLVLTRILAVIAYFAVMKADTPVQMFIAFGSLAMFVDMGLPAMWALMQDISGRHQAQLFGWANMWGNFGAGLQPLIVGWILARYDVHHNNQPALLFCAGALVVSIALAFGINAEKPVVREAAEAPKSAFT
ncbi:MAG: sauU 1 [Verrucomicrobiaceae bacterium]|nr:sauU 1 [Verrucomicrobiaceae bacterium]